MHDALKRELEMAIVMLNAADGKRGLVAFETYQRAVSAEVRPRLLREHEALRRYVEEVDARVATGRERAEVVQDEDIQLLGAEADALVRGLDEEISAAYRRLLGAVAELAREAA